MYYYFKYKLLLGPNLLESSLSYCFLDEFVFFLLLHFVNAFLSIFLFLAVNTILIF